MAEGIEFLPEEKEHKLKVPDYKRFINVGAIGSLLVVAVVLFGLFGYQFYISSQAKRIAAQTAAAEQEILDQSRKEITHRLLVDKLEEASRFITAQLPYSDGYKKIIDILKKAGAVLVGGEFANRGTFTVIGNAANASVLDNVRKGLTGQDMADTFDQVKLVSLTKEKDEPYVFTIDVRFLKKGVRTVTESASRAQP
ncbi:MAG: hypothetical protein A2Z24_01240 [Candidatus Woykebacteria bacterium RBG_16_44_10]|uniref:PilN domain-containing protein n=1 Tax=Candidatus Woykebacteria bacterium RBG_16_44_10 TaxID=1802597 RepID=A0A1G1WG06_9BACT|nr:MAG: hypothetical protein A2Z24_01240 [Candidatus Woykebacteria bacterium RBG_16_44_10]